ncbi:hypothetical protein BC830DRAFT_1199072 [Chytriomyces sp. MP71]|nr:hypothetical protein BC830DRAFT_1199072 [Chytriomyces sp. MP71]
MLLGQHRCWINSTIHNLFELIFLPHSADAPLRFLATRFLRYLFAKLIMPASTAYLVKLIYAFVTGNFKDRGDSSSDPPSEYVLNLNY